MPLAALLARPLPHPPGFAGWSRQTDKRSARTAGSVRGIILSHPCGSLNQHGFVTYELLVCFSCQKAMLRHAGIGSPFVHDSQEACWFQHRQVANRQPAVGLPSTGELVEVFLEFHPETLGNSVYERHVAGHEVNLENGPIGETKASQRFNVFGGHCPRLVR